MRHEALEGAGLSYAPCRYGTSKMYFRGPRRPLDGRYVTFVGGTETYGKFVPRPFPALVEEATGEVCVNFGCVNASIDAFMHEQMVQAVCHDAAMNVVQVTGAINLSNRFYTVHPRRNDRFLRASSVLRAIYPEVDFADFCFTRHMLGTLHTVSPERFEIVRSELQQAWSARMRRFLSEVGRHTILLWFADRLPSDAAWDDRAEPFRADPMFVTRRMIDGLRGLVRSVVVVQPTARAMAAGTDGMIFSERQAEAASALMGVAAHAEAAEAVAGALTSALPAARRRTA